MNEVDQYFEDGLKRRAFHEGASARKTRASNPYTDPVAKAAWEDGYQSTAPSGPGHFQSELEPDEC